jgi:hypothetical protein
MYTYFTYCPHQSDSSKKIKIPLGKIAPQLHARRYCIGCKKSCRFINIEKVGDQYQVYSEPVFESSSIDPYLNPHLYDDVGLEDDEL